ncbi:kinase-like domain-containing protein [Daedaleopsis nitida]|nr:kinase-like domain-containing protein [Daedaleopsis nitida]
MARSVSYSSSSSSDCHNNAFSVISNLDTDLLISLVLDTRRQTIDVPPELVCTIADPPKQGAYNIVYKIDFSDKISWAVRIPITPWDTTRAHAMRLDMIGMQYLSENTSLPIPRIHAFTYTADNTIQYPYIIMDYMHGVRLVDVWNEPSWWTGERSKERTLTSIARHMVELSKLQFDKIGCLDRAEPDGPYHIVSLPCPFLDDEDYHGPTTPIGPFPTTHTYLLTLLAARAKDHGRLGGHYALLRLFIGALPDIRYDGPPFTLAPPDLDSQNVFVDEAGDVAAFIDWDGLTTQPQQLGALSYPAWLTVDWDPLMYSLYQQQPNCDTESDLHSYREMYTSAVDRLSGGTLGDVVRNSHVVSTLAVALFSSTPMITAHLGRYVFGSNRNTFDAIDGIEHSAWFTTDHSSEVAEVKEYDYLEREDESGSDDEDKAGSEDHRSEHSRTEDEPIS